MVFINVKVDGVDEFLGGVVICFGEILIKIVQFLDSIYDLGYDVEMIIEFLFFVNLVQMCGNMVNMQFWVVVYKNNFIMVVNYVGIVVYSINVFGIVLIVVNIVIFVVVFGQWVLRFGMYVFVFYLYGINFVLVVLFGNWLMIVMYNQDFMLCQKIGVDVKVDVSG